MAFLRSLGLVGVFLFSQVSAVQAAPIALSTSRALRTGAWQALKKCDRARAGFWATELERIDPEQAALYRLAWLEAPEPFNPNERSIEESSTLSQAHWLWKRGPELWSDEQEDGSLCPADKREPAVFSELPGTVMESLLAPKLPSYFLARPALRSALREFVFFEWLNGRKLVLPESGAASGWTAGEACEWRALRALSGAQEKSSLELGAVVRDCGAYARGGASLLWATVQIRAGDLFFKEGEAARAFGLFESAVALIPERAMPQGLKYRLAVSGLLGGQADDLVLREAFSALSSPLAPILASSLANLTCEKLGEIRAEALSSVLSKVFRPGALTSGTLELTRACSPSQAASVWKAVLPQTQSVRDRARLLGLLLGAALERRSSGESSRYASQLSELSRRSPVWVNHAFREALRGASVSASPAPDDALTRSVIAIYRRGGGWSESDQAHWILTSRRSARKPPRDSAESPLRLEQSSESSVVRLPIAALGEPLLLQDEIPTHFAELLRSEWREQQ